METPTVKESSYKAGDLSSTPGMGRSPGDLDNPLHLITHSIFLLENPHGQRGLVGYRPWGRKVGHN